MSGPTPLSRITATFPQMEEHNLGEEEPCKKEEIASPPSGSQRHKPW